MRKVILNHKRWLISTSVILLILFGLMIKLHHAKQSDTATAIPVETKQVKVGNIQREVHAVGALIAEQSVQISPEIAGQIATIFFKDGEFVRKGTLLIQLNDASFKSKVNATKAALLYSQTNYQRMLILGKKGIVAKQAVDAALAELKQKQTDAEEAIVEFNKTKLIAPFDGVLSKALLSAGNYVTVGQPLVTITDIQHLRVEYSVSEDFLPFLKLGQSVSLSTSTYPEKIFLGKVAYISPTINKEDRTLSLYAEVPNENRLLTAGLYVTLHQALEMKTHALLVPVESLVPTIDGQKIYKIFQGKAISSLVKMGNRSETEVEILEGVQPNDVVIIAGQDKLHEGSPVTSLSTKSE